MLTQWQNAAATTQVCQISWKPNVVGHGFGTATGEDHRADGVEQSAGDEQRQFDAVERLHEGDGMDDQEPPEAEVHRADRGPAAPSNHTIRSTMPTAAIVQTSDEQDALRDPGHPEDDHPRVRPGDGDEDRGVVEPAQQPALLERTGWAGGRSPLTVSMATTQTP